MIQELDSIVLRRDVPEHDLARGDVGTVVHVYKGGEGVEVEFVTGEGDTVAVLTLRAEDVRPLGEREILHARVLATA